MTSAPHQDLVILVDQFDQEIGAIAKMAAHNQGKLHRAFSIFVVNAQAEILLQRRAQQKYHSGGLWTNTCCSHPRPGESTESAAHRRLQEEMGFDCALVEIFSFTYYAELDQGLIEHEYDHVFLGYFDQEPQLNPQEAEDWCWRGVVDLRLDLQEHPERYTFWLKQCFERVANYLENHHERTYAA
ncbi:MAG: isopentenyl-diphosphate Delta-isomerase [Pseudanabaenaceae cyanobacterium bins.68]|nr:isopentenyl-diphosphate Delta-isomerase [Pseudanabaenaceae cyanobacterium bins.68]